MIDSLGLRFQNVRCFPSFSDGWVHRVERGKKGQSERFFRNLDNIQVTFFPSENTVLTLCSVPKLRFGHNTFPLPLFEAVPFLDDSIHAIPGLGDLPSCEESFVWRLDACHQWRLDDLQLARYLLALSKLDYPRYRRSFFPAGVRWRASETLVRCYSKFLESGREEARGLLRWEVQETKSALRRRLGKPSIVLGELREEDTLEIARYHLKKITRKPLELTGSEEAIARLIAKYGPRRAAKLFGFRELYASLGRENLEFLGLKRRTFYRWRKQLEDALVPLVGTPQGATLPPLLIE